MENMDDDTNSEDSDFEVPFAGNRNEYRSFDTYTSDIGLTGIAIHQQQVVVLKGSEMWQFYSGDLDNCSAVKHVKTMMIGGLFALDGSCNGAIQMINKIGGFPTETDCGEFA